MDRPLSMLPSALNTSLVDMLATLLSMNMMEFLVSSISQSFENFFP